MSYIPGTICIVEEHTPFGSLLPYLRAQHELFTIPQTERDACTVEIPEDEIVDQSILLSYARQVAAGLMHLGKLQVRVYWLIITSLIIQFVRKLVCISKYL